MKKYFIVLWLVVVSISVMAQGSLKGRVTDDDGAGLPFVNVGLKATPYGTATDEDGNFKITAIEPGNYQLVISFVGYRKHQQRVTIKEDQTLDLGTVSLTPDLLGLDEVVVTGTLRPVSVKESPVKTEVVAQQYIQRQIPSVNLVESVSLINGVEETVACGVCFTNTISINGLPGPYTMILMDGSPIYGNLASVYGLNGIPSPLVERVEVTRGPSSTLYGSEAMAGVINIITKDPKYQPLLAMDVMATTHGELFSNLALTPKFKKADGYIGVNYVFNNNFLDENDDGFGDIIGIDRVSAFTKWSFKRKSEKQFTLFGRYFFEDRRNGVKDFWEDRAYRDLRGDDEIYGESIYTHRVELYGTYELATKENLRLDYSYSFHDQDSYYGADYYAAQQHIVFTNLIWNKQLIGHHLMAGATFRYQYYDDNTVATTDTVSGNNPEHKYIPGIFVEDEWQVVDQFTVLGGARLDYYHSHGPIVSPRLSMKVSPSQWTTLRLNFGTGFRIVNLFTEDHAFVTGQRQVEITEDLDPERSYSISLNFNQVYTLGNSQGMLDVNGFFTHFTNRITPNYNTPGKIIYANLDGYARTMGANINIQQQFRFPLSFSLGFNYQYVSEANRNGQGVLEKTAIPYAPEWTALGTISYLWKLPDMRFSYTANLTGPMALPEVYDVGQDGELEDEPRPTRSKVFTQQTLQITKYFRKIDLEIYTGVMNLFDYRQEASPLVGFNDPNANPGFSNNFDTAYAYAPIHGREFFLGIRWNFSPKK